MVKFNLAYLLIPLYVAVSCSGLVLMKTKLGIWSPQFMFGAIFWGVGAGIWVVVLRLTPLSFAFPVASSLLLIGSTVMGYWLLKEDIGPSQIAGIVLIALGVLLVSTGRRAS